MAIEKAEWPPVEKLGVGSDKRRVELAAGMQRDFGDPVE
jgi:hypothetical protein